MSRSFYRYRANCAACFGTSLVLMVGLSIVGCGRGGTRPAGAPDDALEVLSMVLDAWRDGGALEDLREGEPPMFVADEDWEAGKALKSYETPDEAVQCGGHWRVTAQLTLAGTGQAEETKRVAYAVTPGSPVSIIRADNVD